MPNANTILRIAQVCSDIWRSYNQCTLPHNYWQWGIKAWAAPRPRSLKDNNCSDGQESGAEQLKELPPAQAQEVLIFQEAKIQPPPPPWVFGSSGQKAMRQAQASPKKFLTPLPPS